MKNWIYILLLAFMASSCADEKIDAEYFVGEWIYEREFSSTFSYLIDTDVAGTITFRSDGSGSWTSSTAMSQLSYNLNWTFDEVNQQVNIFKFVSASGIAPEPSQLFDIMNMEDDRMDLIYERQLVLPLDPSPIIDEFEHVFLTRR